MDTRVTQLAELDLRAWSAERLDRVEQALSTWVAPDAPAGLGDAMRYAVLDGGKRLRPLLVLAAAAAVGGNMDAAMRAACAVELIHAYSLVHDDMPCMDNDMLRRGKPTVHVQYGEAGALLAGDALQALAFELLTPDDGSVPEAMQAVLCRLLARAAGSAGMAGGQAIDLASVGVKLNETQLCEMHRLKTGALLQGSVLMGASCGALTAAEREALRRCHRPGLPGGGRHPGRDGRFRHAGQDRRQGCRTGQADLCLHPRVGTLTRLCAGIAGAGAGST